LVLHLGEGKPTNISEFKEKRWGHPAKLGESHAFPAEKIGKSQQGSHKYATIEHVRVNTTLPEKLGAGKKQK